MSDQTSTPPKPKVGSLRDRIAAFERPAAASNAPEPKPFISRPKPSGQVSWKPKSPSPPPPSSAGSAAADAADASTSSTGERKTSGGAMSASDAKESIVKGGSLKERMAALQAQGGFMGTPPPPTAPKPSVERPKWKPPPQPVVQPSPPSSPPRRESASHENDGETSDAAAAGEAARPIKPIGIPPALMRSAISEGDQDKHAADDANAGEGEGERAEASAKAGEGEEGEEEKAEVDPEEEERQRRAALAARMAKLGGARIGMAPPVFGVRPGVPKKPDLPKSPPPAARAYPSPPRDEEKESSPPPPQVVASPPSEHAPTPEALKDTESISEQDQPKDASSPPPASTSSESSPSIRAPTSMPVPAAPRRAAPPRKKPARALPTAPADEEQPAAAPVEPKAADEEASTPAEAPEEDMDVSKPADAERNEEEAPSVETPKVPAAKVESVEEPQATPAQAEPTEDVKEEEEEKPQVAEPEPEPGRETLVADAVEHEEPEQPHVQEEEEEDEETHRKRVAERVAKMGGVNPFALPPRRTTSTAEDDAEVAPAPTSPPMSPPVPERRTSSSSGLGGVDMGSIASGRAGLRKSSVDSAISSKEATNVTSPRPTVTEPVEEVDEPVSITASKKDVDDEELRRKDVEKKEVDDETIISDVNDKQVTSEIQELYPSASAESDEAVSALQAERTDMAVVSSLQSSEMEAEDQRRGIAVDDPQEEVGGGRERDEQSEITDVKEIGAQPVPTTSTLSPTPSIPALVTPEADAPIQPEQPPAQKGEEDKVDDVQPAASVPAISSPPPPPAAHRPLLFPAPPTPAGSAVSSPVTTTGVKQFPPAAASMPTPAPAKMVSRVLDDDHHTDAESMIGSPAAKPIRLPSRHGTVAEEGEETGTDAKLFTTESELVEDTNLGMKSPSLSTSEEEKRRRLQAEQQQKDGVLGRGLGKKAHADGGDESDGEGIPLPIPHRFSLEATRKASLAENTTRADEEGGEGKDGKNGHGHDAKESPRLATPSSKGHITHHSLSAPVVSPPNRGLPPPPIIPPPPALFEPEIGSGREDERSKVEPQVPLAPGMLAPATSGYEVLDEEEGDPIDPSFHSPSRRGSIVERPIIPIPSDIPFPTHATASEGDSPTEPSGSASSPPAIPAVPPPTRVTSPPAIAMAQDSQPIAGAESTRGKSIAERMAKLGGIKLGAAPPLPSSFARPPPRPRADQGEGAGDPAAVAAGTQAAGETHEGDNEEEEERARRERIAAKLAGMGGMRIGMMPFGGALPKQSHILKDEPPPPTRAVPPAVPQQQHSDDSEYESFPSASEDGVKVEAEESEIEEVHHEDAAEEAPPPVPPRVGPRRASGTSTKTTTAANIGHLASPPPVPAVRPPVPGGLTTSRSGGKSAHSDYVMVEEPSHGFEKVEREDEDNEAPPRPPPRPAHRPPPARHAPPPPPQAAGEELSSSGQWELPAIPATTIEFGATPDLSLSWTDASLSDSVPNVSSRNDAGSSPSRLAPPLGVSHSQGQAHPHPSGGQELSLPPEPMTPNRSPRTPTSIREPPKPLSPESMMLSPDDLMVIWGRVGVQICEVASGFYERVNKKSNHKEAQTASSASQGPLLVGDGTYHGFIEAVLKEVPNAAIFMPPYYGYLIYQQTASNVQKKIADIMPGDVVEFVDARLKGFKGLQTYNQIVGAAGPGGAGAATGPDGGVVGIVGEVEPKKTKIKVYQAGGVGGQSVDSVSYRLDDLKNGTVRIFRMLEA